MNAIAGSFVVARGEETVSLGADVAHEPQRGVCPARRQGRAGHGPYTSILFGAVFVLFGSPGGLVRDRDEHRAQIQAGRLAERAYRRSAPGSIMIFHDGYNGCGGYRGSTVDAVDEIVDRLGADGFESETVGRLLGIPPYQDVRREVAGRQGRSGAPTP